MTCQSPIPLNLVGSVIQGPKGDKGDKGDRGPAGGEAALNALYVFNTLPEAMAALPTLPEQSSVLVGANLTQEGNTKQFTVSEGFLVQVKYLDPVAYSSGLNVSSSLTTVSKDGVIYAPDPAIVPFTTGAWDPGQWRVVQNTDDSGLVYQFPTLGAAESSAATLPEGAAVVVEGETQGHATAGAYSPDSGTPAVRLQDYVALGAYSGKAQSVDIAAPGIAGRFYRRGSADANGITVLKDALSRSWERDYSGPVNPRWAGAQGVGAAFDDTPAFQKCLDLFRDIEFDDGEYCVDTLKFPNSPSDAIPIGGIFKGSRNAVLLQRTANTPLIGKVAAEGRIYNWEIGPFCVKPKAGSSSTVAAIPTTHFTSCEYNHIQGLSNGSAGFRALFDCAASPGLSYFNTFNQPTLEGTVGYTKCFDFTNNGTGAAGNSNANTINHPNIYNNTGLQVAIDALDSYATKITDPYIEANVGCLAINMGDTTVVTAGALEANGADFNYADARASYGTVIGTRLAHKHDVNFGGTAEGNQWIGVTEVDPSPWINTPPGKNLRVISQAAGDPNAPTLLQTMGTPGALLPVASRVSLGYNWFTRDATVAMRYQFSGADTSNVRIQVTAPAGWEVASLAAGVVDSATGISVKSCTSYDSEVYFTPATLSAHFIDIFVRLKKL